MSFIARNRRKYGDEVILPGLRCSYFIPVYIFASMIILFQGLIIAGSPTNSAAIFFLLNINENLVGYTGICNSNAVCITTAGSSAAELARSEFLPESTLDVLLALQNSLSYSLPVAACSFLGLGVVLITMLLYLKLVVKRHSNYLQKIGEVPTSLAISTVGALWISTIMSWAAAYTAEAIISALIASSTSTQSISRGGIVHTFQWIIFSFSLLLTVLVQAALIFSHVLPDMGELFVEDSENRQENSYAVRCGYQDPYFQGQVGINPNEKRNVRVITKTSSYGGESRSKPEVSETKGHPPQSVVSEALSSTKYPVGNTETGGRHVSGRTSNGESRRFVNDTDEENEDPSPDDVSASLNDEDGSKNSAGSNHEDNKSPHSFTSDSEDMNSQHTVHSASDKDSFSADQKKDQKEDEKRDEKGDENKNAKSLVDLGKVEACNKGGKGGAGEPGEGQDSRW